MMLGVVVALLSTQDFDAVGAMLQRFEAACCALLQPMRFSVVKTVLCESNDAGAGALVRGLFSGAGPISWTDRDGALRLLPSPSPERLVMCAPIVMSAPPWHYEELLDDGGSFIRLTLMSDGEVDVTKVQHPKSAQCSVVWTQPTERFSVGSLVSPIPSSRRLVVDWLATWKWRVIAGSPSEEATIQVTKEGSPNSYLVRIREDGLPRVVAMMPEDASAGFLTYFEYSAVPDKPVWISSIHRITWSHGGMRAVSLEISDHALIDRTTIKEKKIDVHVGDMICDGRTRPYTIMQVAPDSKDPHVPYVEILRVPDGIMPSEAKK